MGNSISLGERLFDAASKNQHNEVRRLHAQGAPVEWRDKQGRTPLMLASAYGELFDMARTLLTLGANVHAFRGGSEGGFPLHHAAKKGNDRTAALLMAHGADPLALNDDGLSALDKGREKGYSNVVRVIEERIALFRGNMREQVLSGPGFLEAIAGSLLFKNCYVVVLPCEPDRRRLPKFILAVYSSSKDAKPKYIIPLVTAELELKRTNTEDPVLTIINNSPGKHSKVKILGSPDQRGQVLQLYNACRGVVQGAPAPAPAPAPSVVLPHPPSSPPAFYPPLPTPPALPAAAIPPPAYYPAYPPPPQHPSSSGPPPPKPPQGESPDDQALAMAIAASLESAQQEMHRRQPSAPAGSALEHVPLERQSSDPTQASRANGWGVHNEQTSYGGWGGPVSQATVAVHEQSPSAPPLPEYVAQVEPESVAGNEPKSPKGKRDAICSICLDQPAQYACVPCGHVAGCLDCLMEIKAKGMGCPICRAQIQQVIRVYLPG